MWINYALYEELEMEDVQKTRDVYKACLDILPHKKFTFAKIWLLFAQFELRQKDLVAARKVMVRINYIISFLLIPVCYLEALFHICRTPDLGPYSLIS